MIRRSLFVIAVFLLIPAAASTQDELTTTLSDIEESLWQGWADHDGAAFREHIVDNHLQINAEGVLWSGKQEVIQGIEENDCDVKGFSLSDWVVHRVSDDTAILTYRGTQDAVCNGEKIPEHVVASAVYVRQDGRWMSASYHETPAEM
jgi:uncharacterized protein (TIGR02246 family)